MPSTFVPEYLTSVNPCRAAPAHPCHPLGTLLFELLREGGDLDAALGLARHVVDTRLLDINAADVLLEAGRGVARLGGVLGEEAEEGSDPTGRLS